MGSLAGTSGHRDSLERETVVPTVGFKGVDDSVGLDLEIALEIAAELLTLISKTSQRYLFSIPTCLMSLLITETERCRKFKSFQRDFYAPTYRYVYYGTISKHMLKCLRLQQNYKDHKDLHICSFDM